VTSRRRHVLRGEMLMDARQEQRHETRRRRIRWWRIGITLVTITTLAGLIALYLSPALRVQNVEVSGTEVVSEQDVLDLLDLEGDSLLHVDTGEIAERIRTLSMVSDVSVEKAWPQTVRIQISERSAWGYWKSGENIYPIDSDGTVLAGVTPEEGAPVIENTGPKTEISPGDRVDPDAVFLAQTLLGRLPDTVSPTVGAIEYSSETGLSVQTRAGYRVVIGDSQNFDYKLSVWKALEAQLGAEGLKGHVLDLRFGDRPALMNGGDDS
jgi:cell division protein FtsQ